MQALDKEVNSNRGPFYAFDLLLLTSFYFIGKKHCIVCSRIDLLANNEFPS
jgi:hypothetical protein